MQALQQVPRCAPAQMAWPLLPNDWPPTCATNTPGAATWRQPRWRGAQAEIVFLAVALGEHVGAEQADRVQAVAPDYRQKPTPTGMSTTAPPFACRARAVQPTGRCAGRAPDCRRTVGIAQDGGVVGQRRDGADVRRAVGDRAQLAPASRAAPACRCSAARRRGRTRRACRRWRWPGSPGCAGCASAGCARRCASVSSARTRSGSGEASSTTISRLRAAQAGQHAVEAGQRPGRRRRAPG